MAQVTTTQNGYDTVSQSGSGEVWSSISNLPYPTEGQATCAVPAGNQSNTLHFGVPQEAADIPTGATFDSMTFYYTRKQTGDFWASEATWVGKTSYSSSFVWQSSSGGVPDDTWESKAPGGDASYWRISGLSSTAIIDGLKNGLLTIDVYVSAGAPPLDDLTAYIKSVTVEITYTTVEGKRGAIIATIV